MASAGCTGIFFFFAQLPVKRGKKKRRLLDKVQARNEKHGLQFSVKRGEKNAATPRIGGGNHPDHGDNYFDWNGSGGDE
jgi:hypothetical protein